MGYLSGKTSGTGAGNILTRSASRATGNTITSSTGQVYSGGQPVSVVGSGSSGRQGAYTSGGGSSSSGSSGGGVSSAPVSVSYPSSILGKSFNTLAERDKAEADFKAKQAKSILEAKKQAEQRDSVIGVRTIDSPPPTEKGPAASGAFTAKQIVEAEQPKISITPSGPTSRVDVKTGQRIDSGQVDSGSDVENIVRNSNLIASSVMAYRDSGELAEDKARAVNDLPNYVPLYASASTNKTIGRFVKQPNGTYVYEGEPQRNRFIGLFNTDSVELVPGRVYSVSDVSRATGERAESLAYSAGQSYVTPSDLMLYGSLAKASVRVASNVGAKTVAKVSGKAVAKNVNPFQFFDDAVMGATRVFTSKGGASQAGTIYQASMPFVSQATKESLKSGGKKLFSSVVNKETGRFVATQAASAGGYLASAQAPEASRQLYDIQNPEQATKFSKFETESDYKKIADAYSAAQVKKFGGEQVTRTEGQPDTTTQVVGRSNMLEGYVAASFPAVRTLDPMFVEDWKKDLRDSYKEDKRFQALSKADQDALIEYKTGKELLYAQVGGLAGQIGSEISSEVGAAGFTRFAGPKIPGFGTGTKTTALVRGATGAAYGGLGEGPTSYVTGQTAERRGVEAEGLFYSGVFGAGTGAFFVGAPSLLRGQSKEILEGLAKQGTKKATKDTAKKVAKETVEKVAKEAKEESFKRRAGATLIDVGGNIFDLAEKPGDIASIPFKKGFGVRTVTIMPQSVTDVVKGKSGVQSKTGIQDETVLGTQTKQDSSIVTPATGTDFSDLITQPSDTDIPPEDPIPPDVPPPEKDDDNLPEKEETDEETDQDTQTNVGTQIGVETSTNIPIISAPGFGPPFVGLPFGSGRGTKRAGKTTFINEIDKAFSDIGVGVRRIQPRQTKKK